MGSAIDSRPGLAQSNPAISQQAACVEIDWRRAYLVAGSFIGVNEVTLPYRLHSVVDKCGRPRVPNRPVPGKKKVRGMTGNHMLKDKEELCCASNPCSEYCI
jgi:hypothetical protein